MVTWLVHLGDTTILQAAAPARPQGKSGSRAPGAHQGSLWEPVCAGMSTNGVSMCGRHLRMGACPLCKLTKAN
jgi:hypothetical protein